jgi:uncharacterized membrane protein YfcA
MELSTALLLAGSGLAAGLVNAIAGGGTFFTFSALVAAGLPPVVANATSSVAVTPGNLSSIWAYRKELARYLKRFVGLGVVSFLGGLVGAYILTETDNTSFSRLVPWLLLFATLLFMASPKIVALARALGKYEAQHPSAMARGAGLAFQFLVAIYGGFFGAGMGIVMLAALAITEGDDFHVINSAKHLCATLIQLVAVVLFILAGLVSWPEAILVAVASVAGGYVGVVFGRKLPAPVIRWLVIAVGGFLTLYFFLW